MYETTSVAKRGKASTASMFGCEPNARYNCKKHVFVRPNHIGDQLGIAQATVVQGNKERLGGRLSRVGPRSTGEQRDAEKFGGVLRCGPCMHSRSIIRRLLMTMMRLPGPLGSSNCGRWTRLFEEPTWGCLK